MPSAKNSPVPRGRRAVVIGGMRTPFVKAFSELLELDTIALGVAAVRGLLEQYPVPRSEIDAGVGILATFVKAGLATSNGEVRRAIANNAIQVNDVRITDDKYVIAGKDLTADGVIKLSFGKKQHVLIKPE